jgi:hypothetical protein
MRTAGGFHARSFHLRGQPRRGGASVARHSRDGYLVNRVIFLHADYRQPGAL